MQIMLSGVTASNGPHMVGAAIRYLELFSHRIAILSFQQKAKPLQT